MAVTVKKVTIAMGHQEYAWALERARLEGSSVSAVVTAAARAAREAEARRAVRDHAWQALETWVLDGVPPTEAELAEARRMLEE